MDQLWFVYIWSCLALVNKKRQINLGVTFFEGWICCLLISNEVSLLSSRNFELFIANQSVRAADRLPTVWWYSCVCRKLSIRQSGSSGCASVTSDVTAGWKLRVRRIVCKRCTVSWPLYKAQPRTQRGRTLMHCNYGVFLTLLNCVMLFKR